MKLFVTTAMLVAAFQGYSQTSSKAQLNSSTSLSQYMWSFSKNKIASEKPLIDFEAIDNWRFPGGYLAVNNDGDFFVYTINRPSGTGYGSLLDSLIIQSTHNSWRMAFAGSEPGFFSSDSKQYVFQHSNDLWFFRLASSQPQIIKNIASYKANEDKSWLAWQVKGNDSLTLRNLTTGKERRFSGITDYNFDNKDGWFVCQNSNTKELLIYNLVTNAERRLSNVSAYSFSGNGRALLLKATDGATTSLQYVNLSKGNSKTIWTAENRTSIGSYSLDEEGKQVAFIIIDSLNAAKTGIWCYEAGTDKAVLKMNNGTKDIPEGQTINGEISFTDNGKYIQFSFQAKPALTRKPAEDIAGLEIWNYKDLNLQSVQAKHVNDVASYLGVLNIESGEVVFLESANKRLMGGFPKLLKGDYALVKNNYNEEQGDRFWEKDLYKDSIWIVSLNDGVSRLLPVKPGYWDYVWFSPGGNWLVYFDASKGCNYYSYDLNTGTIKNISAKVPENKLGILRSDNGNEQPPIFGRLAAWIEDDGEMLVYDNYDIWKLDLTGKQPAVNITNGFGQSNSTVLDLFSTDRFSHTVPIIKASESLLLRGFNRKTKQNGFYRKSNLNAGTPTELYMGSYFMNDASGWYDPNLTNSGIAPMEAKNAKVWIVQRQSATDAPNYYATTDFKNYRRLTNLQPQAQYRWMTHELHSFSHLDGKIGQGILYKPEGFDPTKKYPVLIAFYGAFSNNMFQFRTPGYMGQSMEAGKSPIWFLNNGFLVFTPDIAVVPLKYGPKAFSVIEGAAKYLQQLPYVDANKLGYASHSWSTQLGSYLFTHSTAFSAAAITEGFSFGNMIGQSLTLRDGESLLPTAEVVIEAGNFWENKASWLDRTTVLNADKARAALLLLCNKKSLSYYQDQAVQLFTALRRLNKNAWWLKYDNGSHTLSDQKELRDYTIRYTQFFDHYLKNAPAPLWMTEGIPYKLKGIESRYELDAKGTCNAPHGEKCLICEAWNKQYKKTPEMFTKPIAEWNLDKDITEILRQAQDKRRKELDKQGAIQTKQVMEMLRK